MAPLHILLLGTCDTKLTELLYLRSQILSTPSDTFKRVTLLDVGRTPTTHPAITVPQPRILAIYHEAEPSAARVDLSSAPRAAVQAYLARAATAFVRVMLAIDPDRASVHGVVAAGGSCGTALAAAVMRDAVPLGFPKLIVSTVAGAGGDGGGGLVGGTDLTLMYSVVDVAGLNSVLRAVLENAAGAIVGMAAARRDRVRRLEAERKAREEEEQDDGGGAGGGRGGGVGSEKVRLGITMFGVTTPCVDEVRRVLEEAYPRVEPYVFHATGHGGRAMEQLVADGELDAVLDITTTEIADHLVGGNMSAGPARLEAALQKGLPCLISLGACDMVNFGPANTVPEKFKQAGRKMIEHNSQVTLMRTSVDESRAIGDFIVEKIKKHATQPHRVAVWIPKGGVSLLSTSGQPFEDRDADTALFSSITEGLKGTGVKVHESQTDINDSGTAKELVWTLMGLMSESA